MHRDDHDGNEHFRSPPRDFTGYVAELFDEIVIVWVDSQSEVLCDVYSSRWSTRAAIIEIARDDLDVRMRTSDGARREPELTVDVSGYQYQGLLGLAEVGRGEKSI
jgi:hypothetical protein